MSHFINSSWVIRSGADIGAVNEWLSRFKGDELVRLSVSKAATETLHVLLEADPWSRLRLQASSIPAGAYLATGSVPSSLDLIFTEPVDNTSFNNEIWVDGVALSFGNLAFLDDGYRVRVTLPGGALSPGPHEVFLGNVKHFDRTVPLTGTRKVDWVTATFASTRGGRPIEDPDPRRLALAILKIEGAVTEQVALQQFYDTYQVEASDVISYSLISDYPMYNRTSIVAVYRTGPRYPRILRVFPEHASCFYANGTSEYRLEVEFDDPVETSDMSDGVYVDDDPVLPADMELEADGKVLTITQTLGFGVHTIRLRGIRGVTHRREQPFQYAFVVHEHESEATTGLFDQITVWDDVVLQQWGVRIIGSDPVDTPVPTIEVVGGAPSLLIEPRANADIRFFDQSGAGDNKRIWLTGWSATHSAQADSSLGVDVLGDLLIISDHAVRFNTPFGDTLTVMEDGATKLGVHLTLPTPTAAHEGAFVARRGVGDIRSRLYLGVAIP